MANGITQVYEDLTEADLPAPNAVPTSADFSVPGGNPYANNPALARIYNRIEMESAARRKALESQMQMIEQQAQRYGQEGMSPLDKASILFQAAGALAAPTRSGGLMESIGSAGSAVSGPLMKAAQTKRDREEKMAQLQMARAKLAAEMGSTGPSASELLQLYRVQQEGIQKPGETERLLQTLPPEERAAAIRSRFGMTPQMGETERLLQTLPPEERAAAVRSKLGLERAGELKTLTLPDGTSMSVIMRGGQAFDPITNQPVTPEMMSGRTAATADARRAEAEASGIPVPERDIYRNLTPKQREAARAKAIDNATKMLDKIEVESPTAGLEKDIVDTRRFLEINAANQGRTGPIVGMTPSFSEAAKEMDAIGANMARKMRQPGEGATSDYDARMFQRMTLSTSNPYAVNRNLGLGVVAQRKDEIDKREFMREYLSQNGTLDGADRYWRQYLKDNPIFARGQEKMDIRNIQLNTDRANWRDYFREGAGSSAAPRGSFTRGPNGELVLGGGR